MKVHRGGIKFYVLRRDHDSSGKVPDGNVRKSFPGSLKHPVKPEPNYRSKRPTDRSFRRVRLIDHKWGTGNERKGKESQVLSFQTPQGSFFDGEFIGTLTVQSPPWLYGQGLSLMVEREGEQLRRFSLFEAPPGSHRETRYRHSRLR